VGNRAKTHDAQGKVIVKEPWTDDETKRFWVYVALCVSNIVWNIFYTLPYGLLNLWADENINRNLFGWTVPTAWFYASYGLLIILFSPVVARIYKMLQDRKKPFTLSYKLAVGYLLMGIGCVILMPLVMQLSHNEHYQGNMLYIIIFYAIFAFSELLTLPVMLSAATKFSPKGFSATMISLNMLISWCIGAWLGGEVSALTEAISPTIVFIAMIAACAVFFIGHIVTNKFIEKFCDTSSLA
jgi:POT family proton-dependent oligopeptide transporter